MSVKLRLQRHGRSKKPFFFIVAADARSKRDGKYIDRIGLYDPTTIPARIELNADAAFYWIMKGAEPTNTVRAILSYKGVLYRKHLQRGVSKNALTQDQADAMYRAWIEDKERAISQRIENVKTESASKKSAIVNYKRESKSVEPQEDTIQEIPVENIKMEDPPNE